MTIAVRVSAGKSSQGSASLSSSASCWSGMVTWRVLRFDSSCSTARAPIMVEVTAPCCRTQAKATAATDAPSSSPIRCSVSRMSSLSGAGLRIVPGQNLVAKCSQVSTFRTGRRRRAGSRGLRPGRVPWRCRIARLPGFAAAAQVLIFGRHERQRLKRRWPGGTSGASAATRPPTNKWRISKTNGASVRLTGLRPQPDNACLARVDMGERGSGQG
jgi:hypothetical protein